MIPNEGRLDLFDSELRTLACVAMALQRKKPSRYLEVGIYAGGTIKFIKDHARGIDCTGVDMFEDFKLASNNTHIGNTFNIAEVQAFLGSEVRLIKGDSNIVLPDLALKGEKFDFIFIDGNHKYEAVKRDYENSLPLLNEGGFIAFHNCSTIGDPDWGTYNVVDGGPWQAVTEIKMANKMRCIAEVDRVAIFGLL